MTTHTIRTLFVSVSLAAGLIGMAGCAQNPPPSDTGMKSDPGAPAGGNMSPSGVGVTGAGSGTGSSGATGGTATGSGK